MVLFAAIWIYMQLYAAVYALKPLIYEKVYVDMCSSMQLYALICTHVQLHSPICSCMHWYALIYTCITNTQLHVAIRCTKVQLHTIAYSCMWLHILDILYVPTIHKWWRVRIASCVQMFKREKLLLMSYETVINISEDLLLPCSRHAIIYAARCTTMQAYTPICSYSPICTIGALLCMCIWVHTAAYMYIYIYIYK